MQIGIRALDDSLSLQKNKQPLIHCIFNSIYAKDLEKSIINYNGNPMFSNSLEEYAEITSKAYSLLISLDDLNNTKIDEIEKSIRIARRKGIPIVLDILGVNISFLRKEIALRFINRYNINVLKGNLQEFKTLFNEEYKEEVQSDEEDKTKKDIDFRIKLRDFSRRNDIIVVLEKNYYYITDGFSEFYIDSKERALDKVDIGRGILSGLIAVGIGASTGKEQKFKSVLLASMTMVISEYLVKNQSLNNVSKNELLIDEIKKIDVEKLNKLSKIDYLFVRK